MTQLKVSVIIPIYNTAEYLSKCLNSVLNQSLREIEIICINDCSTDESEEIVGRFQKQDSRIIYIKNKENRGLSVSRNVGIESASGQYIFFLDSDDYIRENALEELYSKAYKQSLDVLYFGYYECPINAERVKREGENLFPLIVDGKDFFCNCVENNNMNVMSWLAIYDRDFIIKNNIMFEKGILHEDDLFYVEVLMNATRVSSVKDCYYEYVRRNNSITLSTNNIQKKIWSLCRIMTKVYKYIAIGREYNKYNNRIIIALGKYIKGESRVLVNYYKKIESFDMSYVNGYRVDYAMLSIASCSLYNGYFQFKLPAKILESIRKNRNIVIYGAGRVGQGLCELLLERGIHISYFAVTKLENKSQVKGIDVKEIQEVDRDSLILIAKVSDSYELVNEAIKLGFRNVIDVNEYI